MTQRISNLHGLDQFRKWRPILRVSENSVKNAVAKHSVK